MILRYNAFGLIYFPQKLIYIQQHGWEMRCGCGIQVLKLQIRNEFSY